MMLTKVKTVVAMGVLALGLCGITGATLGLGREEPRPDKISAPGAPAERKGAARPGPESKSTVELLKARMALAQKGYRTAVDLLRQTRRMGNVLVQIGKPEDVYNWSIRWLQAQHDRSPGKADRVAALEAHLERMTKLKEAVEELSRDFLPKEKVDDAEWYRLEAELWLARAKAR